MGNSRYKFRAWDIEEKKMFYPHKRNNHLRFYLNISGEFVSGIFDVTDRFELMQYAGIKDRNGKEVYEGDVLAYWEDNDVIGVVVFSKFLFAWLCHSPCGNHEYISEVMPDQVVVAGNIHQNKEE